MQDLTVTIVQADLAWENKQANIRHFERLLETAPPQSDLTILPEMFSTAFTMNAAALAEPADGPTVRWLQRMAQKRQTALIASLIVEEDGKYYNRLFFILPEGRLFSYDKRHLFRMAGENEVYSAGRERLTVELKGWKIRPFICYDLRFPVWTRNVNGEYDLAVFIANWPERRAQHWTTLLKARAIENQAYVVGVNRVGQDGLQIEYSGDSLIVDPLGNDLVHLRRQEGIHTKRLSAHTLKSYRQKFPVWMDSDRFEIVE